MRLERKNIFFSGGFSFITMCLVNYQQKQSERASQSYYLEHTQVIPVNRRMILS